MIIKWISANYVCFKLQILMNWVKKMKVNRHLYKARSLIITGFPGGTMDSGNSYSISTDISICSSHISFAKPLSVDIFTMLSVGCQFCIIDETHFEKNGVHGIYTEMLLILGNGLGTQIKRSKPSYPLL